MNQAEQHAKAIRHWAQADRGLRGEELRAAADFIEQQAEALRLERLACGCRWAMNDQRKEKP